MSASLEADRHQLQSFVDALFCRAAAGTYASLRAFRDDVDGTWRRDVWPVVKLGGNGLNAIIDEACRFATQCASAAEPVVFAPPLATFSSNSKADTAHLANGLAVTVEIDAHPIAARHTLEAVLGAPTVIVASGGEWVDPDTGEIQGRLHLHWRLDHPTRTKIEHDFLREIRQLATRLVGGDASAIAVVHPLRWPGSWHRKKTPRLARIIEINPDVEITLGDALVKLRAAVEQAGTSKKPNDADWDPRPHQSGDPQADPLDIAAALAVIPNPDLEWDEWNRIGLAVWRSSGGSPSSYAAFAAWSSKSSKFNPGTTRERWDHYPTSPPNQIGAGTLFHMARQARPDWRKPSFSARVKQDEPPADFDLRMPPAGDDDQAGDAGPAGNTGADDDPRTAHQSRRYRFRLVRFRDLMLSTAARWVVEDLIPRESLVVFWGPPKCGKSFFIFDLVMHVALGWNYRGRRVEKGTVVYIAAEGELGIRARAEAFRQTRIAEDGADPDFFLLTTRLDLVNDLDELAADINAQLPNGKCAIIVIDTLNRTFHGSESKDDDMGAYRDAADRLREMFHCAVLIIHHCGVDGSRPRGHTSLTGAVDAQLAAKRDHEKQIVVTIEWMKDGPEGDTITSRLEVVDVGVDEYGKPITSCVIEPVAAVPREKAKAQRKLSDKNKIALDMLRKALAAHGRPAPSHNYIPAKAIIVSTDLWRRFYLAGTSSDGQSEDTRRAALRRAREWLCAAEIIQIYDEMVWEI